MDRADGARVDPRALVRWLERMGVAALLLAALVPRARDLGGRFGRGTVGDRGCAVAIAAVELERGTMVGPVDPATWVGWRAIQLLSPTGWEDSAACAPSELEAALRLPFLASSLAAAWALWWALRTSHGAGTAMLALALIGTAPVSTLYAQLPCGENLALAGVLVAYGAHARARVDGSPRRLRWLALAGVGWLAAGATEGAALGFAVMLVGSEALGRWRSSGPAERLGLAPVTGTRVTGPRVTGPRVTGPRVTGAAAAASLVCVGPALRAAGLAAGRAAADTASPTGLAPPDLTTLSQAPALTVPEALGWPLLLLACVGVVLRIARVASPGIERRLAPLEVGGAVPASGLVLPLAAGALLAAASLPRGPVLLLTAPAAAAAAASAIAQFSRPLLALRAGLAPFVAAVGLVAMPGLGRFEQLWSAARGPHGGVDSAALGVSLGARVPPGMPVATPSDVALPRAVAFYAWRQINARTQPQAPASWALVPRAPAPGSREAVALWMRELSPESAWEPLGEHEWLLFVPMGAERR